METDMINGFKIDKFNIHNLPVGVKTSTCPLCSMSRKKKTQKCLMINWDTGIAVCQHCGEIIQMHTFKKKEDVKVYKKPVWKNKTDLSVNVVKWFEGRKITQNTLRKLKITEGREWMPQTQKEENAIHFNYFRDGELINVKYRDGRKNFKMVADAEKIPYNLDNIRTDLECIIVEGEIDVLSVVESGFINVVSTPNGSTTGNVNLEWLDNSIDYFDNKEKIILALDSDEPGQNVQKELIRRLGVERCYLVDLSPYKDFNEVLEHENTYGIQTRIKDAKQCPLENVELFEDNIKELEDFYDNGDRAGYKIGLDHFDSVFSTETSQYITVTGLPRSGKSDFVDQMCIGYNLKYNWKVAFCSPENKPNRNHKRKLFKKMAGYDPKNKDDFNSIKSKEVRHRLNEGFMFMEFDSYDLDSVLKKGAELVKRKGIKCLVIDPFNKVRLKDSNRSDVNQYTSDYLTKIDTFCRKYDVLVIIVAHPNKMPKLDNGKRAMPDFYDIKGGGEWFDMSYHGLCVHRDFDREIVCVKVLKVKFDNLGENDAESYFKWNLNNGRYSEVIGNVEDEMATLSTNWDNSCWVGDHKQLTIERSDFQKYVDNKSLQYEQRDRVGLFEEELKPLPDADIPF
jgi:twinkle protein